MIYFLRSSCDRGFIKIGVARDLRQRIDALQAGSPYVLKLVRVLAGGQSKEREIHERFHDAHYRGEWYRPTPELLAFIVETRGECLGGCAPAEPVNTEDAIQRARLQQYRANQRLKAMVGTVGIEPTTSAVSRRRSAAELCARSNEPQPTQLRPDGGA